MKHGGPRHDDGDGDGKENLPPTRNAPAAVPVDQEEDIDVPEVVEQIIGTTSFNPTLFHIFLFLVSVNTPMLIFFPFLEKKKKSIIKK